MSRRTRRYLFSGKVQGVFFRAMTLKLQEGLDLSGYVKNLADGRVELIVEAEESIQDELLSRLKNHFQEMIESVESSDISNKEFSGFEIR